MFRYLNSFMDAVSKPLKTRPLAVFSIISFVFVIMRLYVDIQPLVLFVLSLALFMVILYVHKRINLFITAFIILAAVLGTCVSSHHIESNKTIRKTLDNQEVRVYGTIASVPEKTKSYTSFFVDADKIYHNSGTFKNVKMYTRIYEHNDFKFGDKIAFNGLCFESYSDKQNTKYTFISKGAPIKCDVIVLLSKNSAAFPTNIVPDLRNYILKIGDEFFDGETAMMFKALTAGDKSAYSDELSEKMSIAGISHIAAVSGLHVSILALTLYNLIKKKNRVLATCLSVVLAILFALITGASPSTIRATIMFISFILSKLFIRESDSFTALCFSAMLLSLVNPYVIFDWGFILSFLSVLGIMIFSSPINSHLRFLPKFLREAIATTVSAQIMTTPALTNMFGEISVYSVLANIIVSTFFVATLCLSILFIPISVIPGINALFAFVTGVFLDAIVNTASVFASLPFNVLYADGFTVYEHIVYYTVVLIFVMRKKLSEYVAAIILGICVLVLIFGAYNEHLAIKESQIADNSVMLEREYRVILARDELYDVYIDIKETGSKEVIDALIIEDGIMVDEKTIRDMNSTMKIKSLHIPAGDKDTEYTILAQRCGIEVKYYTHENMDLYEYAKNLAK